MEDISITVPVHRRHAIQTCTEGMPQTCAEGTMCPTNSTPSVPQTGPSSKYQSYFYVTHFWVGKAQLTPLFWGEQTLQWPQAMEEAVNWRAGNGAQWAAPQGRGGLPSFLPILPKQWCLAGALLKCTPGLSLKFHFFIFSKTL